MTRLFMIASLLALSVVPNDSEQSRHEHESSIGPSVKIRNSLFQVEVARTFRDWQRGLMYRSELKPQTGMLFIGQEERLQSFWMKNTLISLDIIFISKNLEIVSIQKRAEPLSERPLPSLKPAQYVLEIAGGQADLLGFQAGDPVELLNINP